MNAMLFMFLLITGAPNNMGLELLMNMFGGLGAGGLSIPNTSDGKESLLL